MYISFKLFEIGRQDRVTCSPEAVGAFAPTMHILQGRL
jgi:hypothetical protein